MTSLGILSDNSTHTETISPEEAPPMPPGYSKNEASGLKLSVVARDGCRYWGKS